MFSEIDRLRNEGRLKGMAKGRSEERKAGAARMIAGGKLTLEEVAEYSRLSLKEVRAIAARVAKR